MLCNARTHPGNDVMDATHCLEKSRVEKVYKYEATDAALNTWNKKTYIALETRIKKYKHEIHKNKKGASKPCDKPLIEISVLSQL